MLVQLIQVPYDSGHPGARMGRGPAHLVAHGAVDLLRDAGHRVELIRVEARSRFPTEISTTFELGRSLARQVRMASNQRRFPVVLAGNCQTCVGTLAGLGGRETGVVWLDAHADLNTPETTRSGMLDGMALATALGLCWRDLAASVPGHRAVPPENVLLVGARDLDPPERESLERLGIARLPPGRLRAEGVEAALTPALDALCARVERVYLHLDLDVLDPEAVAPANAFAAPDGLRLDELLDVVRLVRARVRLGAVALTAYDPAHDQRDRMRDAALRVLEAVTAAPDDPASC